MSPEKDEEFESGWWSHPETIQPLPSAPLHAVLRWILHQLNSGGAEFRGDEDEPPAHTLVLGQEAAHCRSEQAAIELGKNRTLAVNLAGLFAKARERGIEPDYGDLAEMVRRTATDAGRINTDFHYAFELVDILERISKISFVFDAPLIASRAAPHTLDLLQEATRCYLFGLHRACVAACRIALEDSLKQRVPTHELLQERMQAKLGERDGELKVMIDAATRIGILKPDLRHKAHRIRLTGNAVLHTPGAKVEDPWQLLLDTRQIVEELHST
jgi:hypothetical protein